MASERTIVADGEEAYRAEARASFDVILMRLHMPMVDGLTAQHSRDRGRGA